MPRHPSLSRSLFAALLPALLLASLTAATGCGEPFRSVSDLDETPQVLAVRAEPPELGPGEEVTLDALVHWPGASPILVWLVCVPGLGESITSCLENQILQSEQPPSCEAEPQARLCVAGVGGRATYRVPEGIFPDDGERHTFFVNMLATDSLDGLGACGETLAGGSPTESCLLSLKRVVVSHSGTPNVNPVLSHLTLDGSALAPGASTVVESPGVAPEDLSVQIGVAVDAGTVDELFPEGEAPQALNLVVSWFTDCGSLGSEASFIPCVPEGEGGGPQCEVPEVRWRPRASGSCLVHAVVRDGEGGTGFLSQPFEVR